VLAGVIVAAAGTLIAFRAFRPVRSSAESQSAVPANIGAEVPVPVGTA